MQTGTQTGSPVEVPLELKNGVHLLLSNEYLNCYVHSEIKYPLWRKGGALVQKIT
jgi:hypothetical protein